MNDPEEFFTPWEHVVDSWDDWQGQVGQILDYAGPERVLVWRGVANSAYALHSSIYRRLASRVGAPPDEDEIIALELRMLEQARRSWRFDNLSALETLAHLQHYGGPTRLLDVSFNPLVALWFAIEKKFNASGAARPETDGRIFIFDATDRQVDLTERWGGYTLPWETQPVDTWRTGLPLVWRPPAYNDRIPAQNSAFLIGGVPRTSNGGNSRFRKAPGTGTSAGTWTIEEVRQATSVVLSMNSLDRRPHGGAKPTYTIRITADGKDEIRHILEHNFGFNASTIYPDLYGLAQHGANRIG